MLRLALIGYGNVGRELGRLLYERRAEYPFLVTGVHTARHGTAMCEKGVAPEPVFGPAASHHPLARRRPRQRLTYWQYRPRGRRGE